MPPGCPYVLLLIVLAPSIETANRLSEYVGEYGSLSYDRAEVAATHARVRRSLSSNQHLHLSFSYLDRNFNLRLKRDLTVFADDLQVDGLNNVETSHIYSGYLVGEPGSRVYGSILDGVFEGSIHAPEESFYVERSHHYFPQDNSSFHSVIYREKEVKLPAQGGCGVNDDTLSWMHQIQNSGVDDLEEKDADKGAAGTLRQAEQQRLQQNWQQEGEEAYDKYSREYNGGEADGRGGRSRSRRAARREDNKNTCSLFIQTDPLIWRHIKEQVGGDVEKTREEILSLIAHHVTAVNYIYRDTKFDGRVEHRNIKFEVQRIKIDDDLPCQPHHSGEANPFCMENIDVSNFLNLHSLGNHEDFCLAYVFTYRDFTGGTLGLAWVASASGASGGICEKFKTYTETVGGMYQSTKRSLNTGIITFVNYNNRVPPKVSQLTLAHEIGHNFGSPHDYPAECRPGGLSGNYIMFASATSGDRPNNSKFSGCSVGNISNVLDAIVENKKRDCFTASAGAFCGNKIVEAGEECDCGYDDDECSDRCCYPRVLSEKDRMNNDSAVGCARRRNTQCSPSEGPCCSGETCSFVPAYQQAQCKDLSECSWSSQCDGRSPHCPVPRPKPNKTRCNEGTQLCINGECTGSICLEWNLTECFLSSSLIPNIDKRRLCELACQNGTDPASCRSTSEFAHRVGLPPGGISLRPGSPCDNFQGYCDVFFKCRAVDAEGPLARLKNLLLNKETLLGVAKWVTDYWWAVLLLGLAFIIVMGIFIRCCAVHTPSSNPKKAPARRISETLRRPMTTLRRMRHPPQGAPGGRPGPRAGPAHGHGGGRNGRGGRGANYSVTPSAPKPSRSSNHYAGAYGDRNAYEMRQNKV